MLDNLQSSHNLQNLVSSQSYMQHVQFYTIEQFQVFFVCFRIFYFQVKGKRF